MDRGIKQVKREEEMNAHTVKLNIEYQNSECVATVSYCSEDGELELIGLVDCCGDNCLPEPHSQDWWFAENEADHVFDLFRMADEANNLDPIGVGRNIYGEWAK